MKNFKVKFFGSKKERTPITKQSMEITAESVDEVEETLHRRGWVRIHGLKIREI